MTTDYDELHKSYAFTKCNAVKKYSEEYSFFNILGDISSHAVLDLACGDGYYTRLIKQAHAGHIVGVDISEKMIGKAIASEKEAPLGIKYQTGNVAEAGHIGEFEIITAAYLFPYANTQAMLETMCSTIVENLKTNGRLITITLNPNMTPAHLAIQQEYGVVMKPVGELQDGAQIDVSIDTPYGEVSFTNHHWSQISYEEALHHAGLKDIQWHMPQVSARGLKEYGEHFWHNHISMPGFVILEAHK